MLQMLPKGRLNERLIKHQNIFVNTIAPNKEKLFYYFYALRNLIMIISALTNY